MPDTSLQIFDWKQFARHSFSLYWGNKTCPKTSKPSSELTASSSLAERWTITKIRRQLNTVLPCSQISSIKFKKRLERASVNSSNLEFLRLTFRKIKWTVGKKWKSIFWSKQCKWNWISAWNLSFPVFITPIVWNMSENLHYESVYFKEPDNDQEYYWPTTYRAGAAVVSTIRGWLRCVKWKEQIYIGRELVR